MGCLQAVGHIGVQVFRFLFGRSKNNRIVSRPFCFSIIFTSICLAKVVHIYAHLHSISPINFALWGLTFLVQDVAVVLLARLLTEEFTSTIARILATTVAILLSFYVLLMGSVSVSFYIVAGAEIHWRQLLSVPKDAASLRMLGYGAMGCLYVSTVVLFMSWMVMLRVYSTAGYMLNSLSAMIRSICCCLTPQQPAAEASQWQDPEWSDEEGSETAPLILSGAEVSEKAVPLAAVSPLRRWCTFFIVISLVLLLVLRPRESAYQFLSWTLPLLPLADLGRHPGIGAAGLQEDLSFMNTTSLAPAPKLSWLPTEPMAGFEDWYETEDVAKMLHYSPEHDPFHISNLGNGLLEPVRKAIHENGVKVKHVILIKLESTRKDVFPLKKDEFFWQRIAATHPDGEIPLDVQQHLDNLTLTAEFLTGDHTNFDREGPWAKARGGISASNAFTASTFTLKSLVGSLCGIEPLVTDFNHEYELRTYQPCMAHVLRALGKEASVDNTTSDFKSWPWTSVFMQSATDDFDHQAELTPKLGYDTIITKETLVDPWAKHFPAKHPDVNYFGLPDEELKPYLRDAIEDAEANHERLFLTHLTSDTHHPWDVPSDYPFRDFLASASYGANHDVNHYLNTVGYIDGWLSQILQVLNETGVANETLLVLAGDHGVSLPNDGGDTPCDNPHVGVFHVPLVFSHPSLPPIQVDAAVSTMQILPTILDLLISSSSLSQPVQEAALDLLPLYQGQSILRPQVDLTPSGRANWQFTILNSGGSWVAMRSTTAPFRLLVPLLASVEWRFTDLSNDPQEMEPLLAFDWTDFVPKVREKHGDAAAAWVLEAARVSEWWVERNHNLWRWEK